MFVHFPGVVEPADYATAGKMMLLHEKAITPEICTKMAENLIFVVTWYRVLAALFVDLGKYIHGIQNSG